MVSAGEVERRYANVRAALERDGLDAALVCGSEYTGFEGAVTYLSGFQIVHRYAYVLLPCEGEPAIVFPSEARYVGEHRTSWIEEQVFAERPGDWLAERLRGRRVGVYGLDYVMPARDYASLAGAAELVGWDVAFDHARAVKSDEELESVRESVRINTDGFHAFREAYAPGRNAAEVLAPAEELFVDRGRAGRPLGRGLARAWHAQRGGGADERGLRRVLRGGQGSTEAGRDRARCAPGRLEGVLGARLPARPRHRPLDRDDDDRVPEDR
ncbi:MAG: hypothetical protein E6F97_00765 [Actinobacteria bacterium]|nr:MAG: hypothetical protein E6F97_00765 [Actinomycetota bacterium]